MHEVRAVFLLLEAVQMRPARDPGSQSAPEADGERTPAGASIYQVPWLCGYASRWDVGASGISARGTMSWDACIGSTGCILREHECVFYGSTGRAGHADGTRARGRATDRGEATRGRVHTNQSSRVCIDRVPQHRTRWACASVRQQSIVSRDTWLWHAAGLWTFRPSFVSSSPRGRTD